MVAETEAPGGRRVKLIKADGGTVVEDNPTAPKARKKRDTVAEKAAKLAALGPAARLVRLTGGFTSSEDGSEIRVVTAASPVPVAVVRFVQNTAVINTLARARFSAAQINAFDDILDEIRSEEYAVVRVDSLIEFFDGAKRFTSLLETEGVENRIAQAKAVGLELSPEESSLVDQFNALQRKFLAHFKALRPQYPFSKRPARAAKLRVSRDASEISWGSYSVTVRQAKMLWERAFKHWSGVITDNGAGTFRHQHNDRNIRVNETELSIGCQTIPRWSVEQLAIQMDWIAA